ncbi:MAG: hypothetical protein V3T33_01710 [Myxococcota bacterium]
MADPKPRLVSPHSAPQDASRAGGSPSPAAAPGGRFPLRWAIALAVGLALLGFAVLLARVASLQGDVRRLEAQAGALETRLGAAHSALSDYRSRFDQVRSRVAELQEQIAGLDALLGDAPAASEPLPEGP